MPDSNKHIEADRIKELQSEVQECFRELRDLIQLHLAGGRMHVLTSEIAALGEVNYALEAFTETGGTVAEIRKALGMIPLKSVTRSIISRTIPEFSYDSDYVLKMVAEKAAHASADIIPVKEKGRKFLKDLLREQHVKIANENRPSSPDADESDLQNITINESYNDMVLLERDVMSKTVLEEVKGKNATVVSLLYLLCDGDMRKVYQILEQQIGGRRFIEGSGIDSVAQKNFIDHLYYFLGFFGDVSQHLIDRAGSDEAKLKLRAAANESLLRIVQSPELISQPIAGSTTVNLYDLLASQFSDGVKGGNPWFHSDLRYTLYDKRKVGTLIGREISRGALSSVLILVNQKRGQDIQRRMQEIIRDYDSQSFDTEALKKNASNLIEKAKLTHISTDQPLEGIVEALRKERRDSIIPPEPVKIDDVEIFWKTISLRLIHAKTIASNESVRDEFFAELDQVRQEGRPEHPIAYRALMKSIQYILHDPDEYLDLRIQHPDGGLTSVRDQVKELAFELLEEEHILHGFVLDHEEEHGITAVPLIKLHDREQLREHDVNVQRSATSAFRGYRREMIFNAAIAMVECYSFQELMELTRHEAYAYFGASPDRYIMYPTSSASTGWREVINAYLKSGSAEDEIIVSDHGYSSMLSSTEPSEVVVPFIQGGRMLSPKMYAEAVLNRITDRTRMILLSSKTRLGEAPFSGESGTNLAAIAEFNSIVRQRVGSDIPIAIDDCQAIGRVPVTMSLDNLAPDLYITSGSKALGMQTAGILAISRDFNKRLNFSEPSGTLPVNDIVAFMIAINMLAGKHDYMRMEGNFGEKRHLRLDEKRARHLRHLTEHSISVFEEGYGDMIIEELASAGIEHPFYKEQLTPQVIHPMHRNPENYTGVLAVRFPYMTRKELVEYVAELDKFKIDESSVHGDPNTVRLAWNYVQDKEHVDRVFDEIKAAHIAAISRIEIPET